MQSPQKLYEDEFIRIPVSLYQAVLDELEESRKAIDRFSKTSESARVPARSIFIGRDPATFRLEAWFERKSNKRTV